MDLIEARQFDARHGRRHPWEGARLAHVRRLIARHVAPAGGSLACDIGCGDTYVVEALAREHPDAVFYAIDTAFTDEAIAALSARHADTPNLHLFASLERAESDAGGPAALVLLMDVIEHIEDDVSFLRRVASSPLVDHRTKVLITVPAVQALFSAHDRFLGHYRRYSNRRLAGAVGEAGFEVLEAGSFFSTLLVARGVQTVAERLGVGARQQGGVAGWNRGRAVTWVVTACLTLDAAGAALLHRVGIRVPGLSMYAVCRRGR
ncbi:MAG: class I SAM-dependent methyltransferase [Acidobacteriota bacterium]|nr:class I SAM-dependent methyltransferase [Acidobacteriota bacterium]